MKAVFLCGGIGKRMFPITRDKSLLRFLGKTLLEHQINMMKDKFEEFVFICNNFNKNEIEEICKKTGIKYEIAIQKKPLGIADAILSAKEFIDGEILIASPDDIVEPKAIDILLEESKKSNENSYILGYKVTSYFPGGYLIVNEKNQLLDIKEKPGEGNEPSNFVNIVYHIHKDVKTLIKYLETTKSKADDIYELSLKKMSRDGNKIKVVMYDGFWSAIKFPWDIFKVVRYFLDKSETKISPSATISEKSSIEGKVIIEDGVKVLEDATIKGPCYIGKNTIVGTGALVRDYSHMGDNCIIGYKTEIKNSYIEDNCTFHSNFIGDSIISENCSFGAGSITANFRFDEKNVKVKVKNERKDTKLKKFGVIMGKNCKVGVNSSLMPGVKIGPYSIVGPHVILYKDLAPGKKILVSQTHREKVVEIEDQKLLELKKILGY